MDRYAEVAVDAPTTSARTFSYRIPESLVVRKGDLVRVPFGRRTLHGIVFEINDQPQVLETRDVIEVENPIPCLTEISLNLARWISFYYVCSLFEAASHMLPPGGRVRAKTLLHIDGSVAKDIETNLTTFQKLVVERIRNKGKLDQQTLVRAYGQKARRTIAFLIQKKILLQTQLQNRPTAGPKHVVVFNITDKGRNEGSFWISVNSKRAPKQVALLSKFILENRPIGLYELRKEYGDSTIKGLVSKEYIRKRLQIIRRNPLHGQPIHHSSSIRLTESQKKIVGTINKSFDHKDNASKVFVLQGVTGSGKTEIYLDATAHCLSQGKKSVILVPEIILTHQTVQRFVSRFPGKVAILHSGLTAGERFDQWWQTKHGDYDIVIGTRSAIFAPVSNLGLIILDEEHEWTYKQHDSDPRYHARDVALKLAQLTGSTTVLGSASPDIVSYHAALKGRVRLLTLPDRVREKKPIETLPSTPENVIVVKSPLAKVEVVDMRQELRDGNRDIFSRHLHKAMNTCLDRDQQMILFINRRGSSFHVQCRHCGLSIRCRRCEVSLTYHSSLDRLICHYCGYRCQAPRQCPQCLRYTISYSGAGTQSVTETVVSKFPGVSVLRLDSDVAHTAANHRRLLDQFSRGDASVLVGTQMITKGLHFPNVTLVGVMSADIGLNIPDFRSSERVFQLLCQVAGRAGRGESEGSVVVQTYQPDNYAIRTAAAQDYQSFYSHEINYRREQGNPPFNKLVRLLYSNTNQSRSELEAERLANLLKLERDASGHSDIDVLGPTPALLSKLRGRYRWQLLLRGTSPRTLLDRVIIPNTWTIDIDPVSLI